MKVKSESDVTQSCLTLSDPVDCSLPDSSIHGIFQARVLEWGAIAFSRNVAETGNQETKHHTQKIGEHRFLMLVGPEELILQALSSEQGGYRVVIGLL